MAFWSSLEDVQLCLQWDGLSRSLFSGAIDGTLSRWDLNSMTLADLRKGSHKKAINDLLMVQDINLLASASSAAWRSKKGPKMASGWEHPHATWPASDCKCFSYP